MRLANKTAVVTGGASGFGKGIVEKFALEGADVLVADLDGEGANEVATAVGGTAFEVDVSADRQVAELGAFARERFGRVDILVNNAGTTHDRQWLERVPEEDFDLVFRVNCKSVFLTARHFLPTMKAAGKGNILNVASTAGLSPRPQLNWYNASKGWMISATKTMAIELAESGIRVNALAPVAGETPLLKRFIGSDSPEARATFLSTIPLGRFSLPSDVADAACYLCSDEASLLTGIILPVDGGRLI